MAPARSLSSHLVSMAALQPLAAAPRCGFPKAPPGACEPKWPSARPTMRTAPIAHQPECLHQCFNHAKPLGDEREYHEERQCQTRNKHSFCIHSWHALGFPNAFFADRVRVPVIPLPRSIPRPFNTRRRSTVRYSRSASYPRQMSDTQQALILHSFVACPGNSPPYWFRWAACLSSSVSTLLPKAIQDIVVGPRIKDTPQSHGEPT